MMGVVTKTMMVLGPWPACRFRETNVVAMGLSLSRIGDGYRSEIVALKTKTHLSYKIVRLALVHILVVETMLRVETINGSPVSAVLIPLPFPPLGPFPPLPPPTHTTT